MVGLFVAGKQVGTLDVSAEVLKTLTEAAGPVEFRTDAGKALGAFQPKKEPIRPWEEELTKEEIQRRINEPGAMSLAEFFRQWKGK
ncbi:MAG: hypothetical protein K2P78_11140 [Gemmataceae bacterium]|nr:hypothetical protein [Gemmataceae bacterium]